MSMYHSLSPVQGTGQDTKVTLINRENQQDLKVQSSRRGSELKKKLSGLGYPIPPGLYSSSAEVLYSSPGMIQDTPRLQGRFPVPRGLLSECSRISCVNTGSVEQCRRIKLPFRILLLPKRL